MARNFSDNNIYNRVYREEILPMVRGAAEEGRPLSDLDIPDMFKEEAESDYDLAGSSVADNAMKDVVGMKDAAVGLVKKVGSKPVADIDLQTKSPEEIGGDEIGKIISDMLRDGGAEDMAAEAIDAPMRALSDPKGEAKAHPVMAAIGAIPVIGAGAKKLMKKFSKVPDLDAKKSKGLPDADPDDFEVEIDVVEDKTMDGVDDILKSYIDEDMPGDKPKVTKIKQVSVEKTPDTEVDWDTDDSSMGEIIEEQKSTELDPKRLSQTMGADVGYATKMADKAVERIQGTVGDSVSQSKARKMMENAQAELDAAVSQAEGMADKAKAKLKEAEQSIRIAQGSGQTPADSLLAAAEKAEEELAAWQNAAAEMRREFRKRSGRFDELDRNAITKDATNDAAYDDALDEVMSKKKR